MGLIANYPLALAYRGLGDTAQAEAQLRQRGGEFEAALKDFPTGGVNPRRVTTPIDPNKPSS